MDRPPIEPPRLVEKRRQLATLIVSVWSGLTPDTQELWSRLCPELLAKLPAASVRD